jgi:F-type H+-transporting ATPase subunit b
MAETSTHTETPGGTHRSFPPFEKETFASQVFWLALTFVALYLVMKRVALPRLASIMEARAGRIKGDLAEAERLRGESEAALATYEKALADARARAQALANETHQRLAAQAEETRKALESKLNARLAEAEKAIAATKQAAMANVRGIAADAASAIVERLIGSVPAAKAVDDAVADALKR